MKFTQARPRRSYRKTSVPRSSSWLYRMKSECKTDSPCKSVPLRTAVKSDPMTFREAKKKDSVCESGEWQNGFLKPF